MVNRSFDLGFKEMMLWQWRGEKSNRLFQYCRTFSLELSTIHECKCLTSL